MNRSASLHTYDFATTPYDGDARQAHQLIPFIQSKLGAKQLSYILNTHEYPDPKTEPLLVILESQHNENMDTLTRQYQIDRDNYELRLWPLYQRAVLLIQADASLSIEGKSAAIEALQIPARPALPILPQSHFTNSMGNQLSKSRDNARRFDQAADEALQLIRTFLSTRILNKCADVLHDHKHTSRQKLLAIWNWLQRQRALDPQIISEIKRDMNALPEITNFDEAVTTIGQMNQLQAELTTLQQPLSDTELIITHANKYAAIDQFVNIQLKYLQATSTDAGELAPSFKSPTRVPTISQELSWAAYSLDVATYARAHNHVKRTTSVLSASSSFPLQDPRNRSPPHSRDRNSSNQRSRDSCDFARDRSRSRDRSTSVHTAARHHERSTSPMNEEKLRRYREAKARAYAEVRAQFGLLPPASDSDSEGSEVSQK